MAVKVEIKFGDRYCTGLVRKISDHYYNKMIDILNQPTVDRTEAFFVLEETNRLIEGLIKELDKLNDGTK